MTKNKLTIIVMVGPPASGKTSWSKEFVKGKSTWIRVNRDDLRLMCGDYWIPSREKLINTLEETTITSALEQGYNVIKLGLNGKKFTFNIMPLLNIRK